MLTVLAEAIREGDVVIVEAKQKARYSAPSSRAAAHGFRASIKGRNP